jgi:hypothetical protein
MVGTGTLVKFKHTDPKFTTYYAVTAVTTTGKVVLLKIASKYQKDLLFEIEWSADEYLCSPTNYSFINQQEYEEITFRLPQYKSSSYVTNT